MKSICLALCFSFALAAKISGGCPGNQIPVQCFANPCDFANCPRYPNATRVTNYCGGCNCLFKAGQTDVTNKCECPAGQPVQECPVDPCLTVECHDEINWVKVADVCGTCSCRCYRT
ncbi:hypothetical protein ScPMuIL_002912 [Solemya velum]